MASCKGGPIAVAGLVVWWTLAGCSPGSDDDDDAADAGDVDGDASVETDVEEAGEFGAECVEDVDCNDDIDCTADVCRRGICSNIPDDEPCQDDEVCNGHEICYPRQGCGPGEPFRGCNDGQACTMDRCVEPEPGMAPGCEHLPLDRDADTHIDTRCDGDDCNDVDPLSHPGAMERCFDTFDNDCDTFTDLTDPTCQMDFDSCTSPRPLVPGVEWEAFLEGSTADINTSCDSSSYQDVVFSFEVTETSDVLVSVDARDNYAYVALQRACGDRTSELRCLSNFQVSIFERQLAPGTYYVVVSSYVTITFLVRVDITPSAGPAPGDVCAGPIELTLPARVTGDLTRMGDDYALTCASWEDGADTVYTFELAAPADLTIDVSSPRTSRYVSLQTGCDPAGTVVACGSGYPYHRTLGNVAAGRYYLWVESEAPGAYTLDVSAAPPTPPPVNDACSGAIDIGAGGAFEGSLLAAADDYTASCYTGGRDVAYVLTLEEPRAVSLVLTGYYAMAPYLVVTTECGERTAEWTCQWYRYPTSLSWGLLPAGTYYFVVESRDEGEFRLDVTVSEAMDPCADVDVIDASGTIRGTTTGEFDDFQTTCGGSAMSPDVAYRVDLAVDSAVSFEITEAPFDTVLHLRSDCAVPSSQIVCDDDGGEGVLSRIPYGSGTMSLAAGSYTLVVDGYGSGSSGNYTLQTTITPE
jgi:hypothetical protein